MILHLHKELLTLQRLHLFAVPPEVEPMPHKVAREGRTVIMVCRASGVPEPKITWHRLQPTGGLLTEELQVRQSVTTGLLLTSIE